MLEPSRRFFETQRFFDALGNSGMPHSDIRVGPVLASTIYLFDPSVPGPKNAKEEFDANSVAECTTSVRQRCSRNRIDKHEQVWILRSHQETHTMTPLYHAKKSDGRWFVRAFALLIIGVPAVAQQANVSAPLTADEVMGRVVEMNEVRAKALESYSSVRSYHLECHCLSHKQADMVVRD